MGWKIAVFLVIILISFVFFVNVQGQENNEKIELREIGETSGSDIEETEETEVKFNGYIIEFEEIPTLEHKKNLEKKIKKLNREIDESTIVVDTIPNLGKRLNILNTRREINNLEDYKEKLKDKQEEILKKANNELSKGITGNVIAEEDIDDLESFTDVFNGVVLDLNEEEIEKIRDLEGVKNIYPNIVVEAYLYDSVPLINADDLWQHKDNSGNYLTGEGMIISIIDTGVDYTHPDLGGCFGDSNEPPVTPPENITLAAGCNAMKFSGQVDNKINIVVIPSGFGGNMGEFENRVQLVFDKWESEEVFGHNVDEYNLFYVSESASPDSFCASPEGHLICDHATAFELADYCPYPFGKTIVVLHNSDIRQGSWDGVLAVATVGADTVTHELGHGIFHLADEYTMPYLTGTPWDPNCDYAGCSKWEDLAGLFGVDCISGCTQGYFMSEYTVMMGAGKFEEVNQRIACCKYKQLTGEYPYYCNKFTEFGQELDSFCGYESSNNVFVQNPEEYLFFREGKRYMVSKIDRTPSMPSANCALSAMIASSSSTSLSIY